MENFQKDSLKMFNNGMDGDNNNENKYKQIIETEENNNSNLLNQINELNNKEKYDMECLDKN